MSSFTIEVAKLGKEYERRGTKADATLRGWLQGIGKRQAKAEKFWALRDLNLQVKEGEVLGIVGRNGSGKSTLLKILSRITPPTTGQAILKGHVASLLEVGTGFHHELTGRENIYLNGAILGMSRADINKQYKAIAAFSGVADFMDTKVKNYSSGMYVRLAFSVAAHLQTDILLVDEVLAVGDAEFQKRSLGKMNEVVRDQGRTIMFVSHNLPLVRKLCDRCIGLDKGQLFANGTTDQVLLKYNDLLQQSTSLLLNWSGALANKIKQLDIRLNQQPMEQCPAVSAQETLVFDCRLQHEIELPSKMQLSVFREGIKLFTIQDGLDFSPLATTYKGRFTIQGGQLRPGMYQIGFGGFANMSHGPRFLATDIASFIVTEDWKHESDKMSAGWMNPIATGERIQ